MLKPPRGPHRANSRSPEIRPIGDEHPLFSTVVGTDHWSESAEHSAAFISPSSQASQISSSGVKQVSVSPHTEVYVHRVSKTDTLPKVILQYQIPVNVLRRANRMFANDSIQFRDTLLLPVKACQVVARKTDEDLTPLIQVSDSAEQSSYFDLQPSSPPASSQMAPPAGVLKSPTARHVSTATFPRVAKPMKQLEVVRKVFIHGIGRVDMARVPASSLSYFPPSKTSKHSELARTSMDKYRDSLEVVRPERSSFESMRIGAGKIAADAYNGTQGLLKRMKERKNTSEIDLIEL